jgi:hypothetical protein
MKMMEDAADSAQLAMGSAMYANLAINLFLNLGIGFLWTMMNTL